MEKKRKKRVDLLATFGGFDENNLIELLLKNYEVEFSLRIILGLSTKTHEIKKYQKIADSSHHHSLFYPGHS